MIKAVIFDMDGTLIDSQPIWYRVSTDFFQKNGFPITMDDMIKLTGSPVGKLVDFMLQAHGQKEKDRAQLVAEWDDPRWSLADFKLANIAELPTLFNL